MQKGSDWQYWSLVILYSAYDGITFILWDRGEFLQCLFLLVVVWIKAVPVNVLWVRMCLWIASSFHRLPYSFLFNYHLFSFLPFTFQNPSTLARSTWSVSTPTSWRILLCLHINPLKWKGPVARPPSFTPSITPQSACILRMLSWMPLQARPKPRVVNLLGKLVSFVCISFSLHVT